MRPRNPLKRMFTVPLLLSARALEQAMGPERRFLFVNAPARSGSSLLSHVLCSHPDISGFGEAKIRYESPASALELVSQVCLAHRRPWIRSRYVLDKLVLNDLLPDMRALSGLDTTWVFLLRDAGASLSSYMKYHRKNEQQALTYYLGRWNQLERDAGHIAERGRSVYLSYEGLLAHPDATLRELSGFLGLETPLCPHYRRDTTKSRSSAASDQSINIREGRILSDPVHPPYALSGAVDERARVAHNHCRDTLQRYCAHVIS